MFGIIRLIVGCVFLGCSFMVIRAKARRTRISYIICASISVVLIVVLAFLPIENLFITFDSAEEAYEYYSLGESDIELTVEGDSCDFVVDRKNDADTYLIIPKTADGWKIGIGSNTKRIVQKVSDTIVIYVYQYKNTKDYFITICDVNGGVANVSDDYNTQFYSLKRYNASLGAEFVTYYAYVPDFNPQYSVIVNGNKITLE